MSLWGMEKMMYMDFPVSKLSLEHMTDKDRNQWPTESQPMPRNAGASHIGWKRASLSDNHIASWIKFLFLNPFELDIVRYNLS